MKINIARIAKLANLSLLPNEKLKLEKQLDETIDYVKKLNEVETKNVESTSQVTGLENITREDISKPSLTQDQALSNAKSTHKGFFKVNAVFEENE